MKIVGYFDRVILAIYTISLGIVSLGLVAVGLGWHAPLEAVRTSSYTAAGRIEIGFVGLVLLIVSVRLMGVGFIGSTRRRSIVHQMNLGDVRISLHAIEGMIQRLVRNISGVREAKALIESTDGGISVRVRATVGPEVTITELTETIQDAIREQVRRVVGIEVRKVRLDVDHITPEVRRGRVE